MVELLIQPSRWYQWITEYSETRGHIVSAKSIYLFTRLLGAGKVGDLTRAPRARGKGILAWFSPGNPGILCWARDKKVYTSPIFTRHIFITLLCRGKGKRWHSQLDVYHFRELDVLVPFPVWCLRKGRGSKVMGHRIRVSTASDILVTVDECCESREQRDVHWGTGISLTEISRESASSPFDASLSSAAR